MPSEYALRGVNMDANRFDEISKLFAERRLTRRQGGVGLASGALAAVGGGSRPARAQSATPTAAIQLPSPDPGTIAKTEYLFVQSFKKGTIVANTGGGVGDQTLTLEQGLGQTIYFSDRPNRIVGATPTPAFLEGLGFSDENPPNAALVFESGPEHTDFAVFELFNPRYDEETSTATYDVQLLEEWEWTLGMSFSQQEAALAQAHPEFGTAHLFFDGCADRAIYCYMPGNPDY